MNEDQDIYGIRKGYVYVEGEFIPVSDTIFIGIHEDLFGQDVYEFKYNGKVYSSHVIVK